MVFLRLLIESFYAPRSVYRMRQNDSFYPLFLHFYALLAYSVLGAHLFWAMNLSFGFFSFFSFVLFLYFLLFIKTLIFNGLLNWKQGEISSFHQLWGIQILTLWPIFIFLPLSTIFSSPDFFIVVLLGVFFYINYQRFKWIHFFLKQKFYFIWVISLLFFMTIILLIVLGTILGFWALGNMVESFFKKEIAY